VRLLYLYPSGLTSGLIDAILESGVPTSPVVATRVETVAARDASMGDADRFLERIAAIRASEPDATFRSSFILAIPGDEDDQRRLIEFIRRGAARLGRFLTFSSEEGTHADTLGAQSSHELALERLREVSELQDDITARRRDASWVRDNSSSSTHGVGRSVRECPEIDGM